MATAAVWRQVRHFTKPVKIIGEHPEMLPSRTHYNPFQDKAVMKARVNVDRSTIHPEQRVKQRAKHISHPLSSNEEQFAAQARHELAEQGISDKDRFHAWVTQDHSKFPEKVKDLRPEVRSAVKFGGLGITEQEEALREKYREQRRKELALRQMKDSDKEREAAGDLAVSGFLPHKARDRKEIVKRKMVLEEKYNEAAKKRREMYDELKERVFSGMSDRDVRRKQDYHVAQSIAQQEDTSNRVRETTDARRAVVAEQQRAKGQDVTTVYNPPKNGTPEADISNNAAIVARSILADVPTRGQWPIVVPLVKRGRFIQLQDEAMQDLLRDVGKADRGRLNTIMFKKRVSDVAMKSWKDHVTGAETGGVNNVRDWRQKNTWEFKKGSEPSYYAEDPKNPFSKVKFLERATPGQRDAAALLHDPTHAGKPKNRYYSLWSSFNRRLNARYSKGRMNNVQMARTVGTFTPNRVRKAEHWFNN